MSTQNTEPDFGEPWETNCQSIYDRNGPLYFSAPTPELASRLVQCVNACQGMADPAAEIAHLRDYAGRTHELATQVSVVVAQREAKQEEIEAMQAAITEAHEALKQAHCRLNIWFNAAGKRAMTSDAHALVNAESALASLQPYAKP